MHKERQRQLSDPFDMFGGFGNFGGSGGSIFGRNPFDDPFFTRPFGDVFGSNNFLRESPLVVPPSGPIIKELGSDDEEEEQEKEDDEEEMEGKGAEGQKSARAAKEPFVDHPDDEMYDGEEKANYRTNYNRSADGKDKVNHRADYNRAADGKGKANHRAEYNCAADSKEKANYRTDYNRAGATQPQSVKVHSCKVTYGGVDGVYYSSSATRRMGSDGTIMEDCKEADKRTGEATHRISRGLNDKGHSVFRKLNSDGKVDMSQMLHNLNEDELGSFEEAWKDNGIKHLPPVRESSSGEGDRMSDWGGFLLPPTRHMGGTRGSRPGNDNVADPSGGRTKKVVRIPID